jgi:hypothetical protein
MRIVSMGTRVVPMCMGGALAALDPSRGTLVNVNALGDPVPSARFMDGRDCEINRDRATASAPGDVARVLADRVMFLPSVLTGSGPKGAAQDIDLDALPLESSELRPCHRQAATLPKHRPSACP